MQMCHSLTHSLTHSGVDTVVISRAEREHPTRRHVGIVTAQSEPDAILHWNKHDGEMSIWSSIPQAHSEYIYSNLLESDLKMSKSYANVVRFDENVSHLSNSFGRNEHLLMNETAIETETNIGTIDEITLNQRTYVTIQDNKKSLERPTH